jgi:tRNA (guanine-N7-)-methyltransferase
LPLEQLQPHLHTTPPVGPSWTAPAQRLEWSDVFGNANPVEIEVGFGKGLFLLNAGKRSPQTNFLGIEIVRKYQLFAATRLAMQEVKNVKVACTDARLYIRDFVADASVQTLYLFFPDPWWKTRHHKRRVFTEEFARETLRILKSGGALVVVTDVADYAEMVRETVALIPEFVVGPPPVENEPTHDMDYLTNFERKFRKEGRTIHRMRWEKQG